MNATFVVYIDESGDEGFLFGKGSSDYGFAEERYSRLLKPVVYHRQGSYMGYGIKFWPKEIQDNPTKGINLKWLEDYVGSGTQEPTR